MTVITRIHVDGRAMADAFPRVFCVHRENDAPFLTATVRLTGDARMVSGAQKGPCRCSAWVETADPVVFA